ncbi:MAG: SIMPL domain-containing protein [Pseudoxanthomonas sp.]
MKRMLFGVALVLSALCSGTARAQDNSLPSQPHLLVKGEAKREVKPDRFTLAIELRAVDVLPDAARRRTQESAASVLALFAKHGVLADSVHASALSIKPETRYKDDEQVFQGTAVERDLSGTFTTLDQVRQVLASLKTSEEVQVNGISPAYADESSLRGELKRSAAEQSRAAANELANAYGVRISALYSISEVAPQFAYGVRGNSWGGGVRDRASDGMALDAIAVTGARAQEMSESLEAGSITLSENVYAIFLIAQ